MNDLLTPDASERIWKALSAIQDPEIPVLSLVDLNVIRAIRKDGLSIVVTMTPTFAGCPAMDQMKRDVLEVLESEGYPDARIDVVYAPSWSTDELSRETQEKLRTFGIAPPPRKMESLAATLVLPVPCPHCGSVDTKLESSFGSTLCKQLFFCSSCRQSFDRFKPL